MKKTNIARLAGALLLAATLPCAVSMVLDGVRSRPAAASAQETKPAAGKPARTKTAAKKAAAAQKGGRAAQTAKAVRPRMVPADPPSAYAALSDRIDRARADEDLDAMLSCAEKALTCPDAEVRKEAVDALEAFGDAAFAELTPFLADDDPAVRDSALMTWCGVVAEFEDDADKVRSIEAVMRVLSDPETLESIADEYLKADDRQVVESLVRLLDEDLPAAARERVLETYEFVTGNAWESSEAALAWIATACDESV